MTRRRGGGASQPPPINDRKILRRRISPAGNKTGELADHVRSLYPRFPTRKLCCVAQRVDSTIHASSERSDIGNSPITKKRKSIEDGASSAETSEEKSEPEALGVNLMREKGTLGDGMKETRVEGSMLNDSGRIDGVIEELKRSLAEVAAEVWENYASSHRRNETGVPLHKIPATELVSGIVALARRKRIDTDVDLMALGQDSRCKNLSGADLSALINKAAMAALEDKLSSMDINSSVLRTIKNADFTTALEKISSVSDKQI